MREDEYEAIWRLEDTHWWYRALRRLVLTFAARAAPGGRALDAGCGTGGLLKALSPRFRVVGIDYSQLALSLARRKVGYGLIRASVENLPFGDGTFDVVTSMDVLYHMGVRDDVASLREMRRVLKPGGVLLINLPAFEFLRGPHDRVIATRHRYTRAEICGKLRAAGLAVERATYWNFLLFPPIAAVRMCRRKREAESDLRKPSAVANVCLNVLLRAEAMMLKLWDLPIGVSVFCVARRLEKG